jgi:flagellar biosynthetic protein FlhB
MGVWGKRGKTVQLGLRATRVALREGFPPSSPGISRFMAKDGPGGERTEKATSHKRSEERKKGHVLKSQDVVTAAFILVVFVMLRFTAKLMLSTGLTLLTDWIGYAGSGFGTYNTIDGQSIQMKLLVDTVKTVGLAAGIVLFASMFVSVMATGIQTKFLFSTQQMKPKLSKFNPINGMKKFFNPNAFFEQFKSLIKMTILVIISFSEIRSRLPEFVSLFDSNVQNALLILGDIVFTIAMKIALAFVIIAVIDFFWQRFRFEEDLKMSKQEVKEEYKNMEGDPKIKGKRRSIQQKLALQRMMQAIPEADVVIRNPTHYAVAVKYKDGTDSAPKIIAKGKDRVALRIIDIAREAGVMLVENRPLARVLFEKVDVDREIPSELYKAVAEVLAFVFKLKKGEPAVYAPKAVVEM